MGFSLTCNEKRVVKCINELLRCWLNSGQVFFQITMSSAQGGFQRAALRSAQTPDEAFQLSASCGKRLWRVSHVSRRRNRNSFLMLGGRKERKKEGEEE